MPFDLPIGDPCAFCEVIEGRMAKGIVEETELALTLVSWNQFEVGQVLVIPRRHAPTLLDLTNEEIAAVMDVVRRVADAPVVTYDPDGLTLYQNNGVVSRQEVPRRRGSDWGEGPPHIAALENKDESLLRRVRITAEGREQVADRIKANL